MKVRYDVARLIGGSSTRFEDLKAAFTLAKEMAKYYDEEVVLIKLVWDDTNRIIENETVLVSASGKFRYI